MPIVSINPSTGATVKEFEEISDGELTAKIEAADKAFHEWRNTSFDERGALMVAAAQVLRDDVEQYARMLTEEMGKTIGEARAEVLKCAWNFEHYAEQGEAYLESRQIETDGAESYVQYDPLGVILNVMPWNFALWQALRMAAPILMAGNTIVLKHASNVPRSAVAIEQLFRKAGFPDGVYTTLLIGSSKVESVITNPIIKGAALTGSEYAGSMVGSQAGREIKPVVLELGGSDPSIVLADADVQFACETAAQSRLMNNGQSCVGAKRFIVHEDVYEDFLEKLTAVFEAQVIGDPIDEATTMGPVVSKGALDELVDQLERNKAAGVTVHHGGNTVEHGGGFFIEPTILTGITPEAPAYTEEFFGPVVGVYMFSDLSEAIELANATDFGLGASVYTADTELAKKIARDIDAGGVFINGMVKSDPRMPFGGTKRSGVGRELSEEGIRAFTNAKTVWVK